MATGHRARTNLVSGLTSLSLGCFLDETKQSALYSVLAVCACFVCRGSVVPWISVLAGGLCYSSAVTSPGKFLTVDVGAPASRSPAVGVHWRVQASWHTAFEGFQPLLTEILRPLVSSLARTRGRFLGCMWNRASSTLRLLEKGVALVVPCAKRCVWRVQAV